MIQPVAQYAGILNSRGKEVIPPRNIGAGEVGPARVNHIFLSMLTEPDCPQIGATGGGIPKLRDVLKNPYYMALMDQRKETVTEAPWMIEPASEDERDIEIADFVRWNLEALPGHFADEFRAILSAVDWGYSLHELVWERGSTPFGDKVFLTKLADKPQWEYGFKLDKFNNIEGIGLWSSLRIFDDTGLLPPDKFMVVTYRARAESPYGQGLLAQSWWPDQFMRVGQKMWATFLDSFGAPMPIAKYPPNTDAKTITKLEEIVQNMQSQQWATMQNDIEIEWKEHNGQAGAGYEDFISEAKELMQLSVLGQTLTTSEGQHGTQALGTVHKDVLDSKAASDREMVFTAVNEQLIVPLVAINFASGSGVIEYPKLVPEKGLPEDQAQRIANVKEARPIFDISEAWAREHTGIPAPSEDEELLSKPSPPPVAPSPPTDDEANNGKGVVEAAARGGMATFATTFRRKLTKFEDARTLTRLSNVTDRDVTPAIDAAGEVLTLQRDAIITIVRKTGKIESALLQPDTFATSAKKSRQANGDILQRTIVAANLMGQVDATDEIRRKGNDVPAKFAMLTAAFAELPLIPPQDAIDVIAAKTPLTKGQLSKMKREAKDVAFSISGTMSLDVVKAAKGRIIEGLQNGSGVQQFVDDFSQDIRGFTAAGVAVDSAVESESRLRTIFRTNTAAAYNTGRSQLFFESGPVGDFVTHLQYSAILDDRVREAHAAMDGLVFAKGDPIWDTMSPPNGFNCRCVLFPVTQAEADDGTFQPSDVSTKAPVVNGVPVAPDKGFGSG